MLKRTRGHVTDETTFPKLVSLACHDLRTPLATVYGFARTIARAEGIDPKLGGYADFDWNTRHKFRAHDHVRLAAVCRELDERGVRWAVSNGDTPLVRELFRGYRLVTSDNRREINLNSGEPGITELLVMNYGGG